MLHSNSIHQKAHFLFLIPITYYLLLTLTLQNYMAFEISQELSGEWERALDKHQMVSR